MIRIAAPLVSSLFATVALLAEGTTTALPSEWANLSAMGILATVVIWLVTRVLPDHAAKANEQSKMFAETLQKSQEQFTNTLDKMHARAEDWEKRRQDSMQAVANELASLQANCAAQLISKKSQ